ncbi:MAG TPA: hypothetical protein O0X32_00575 [Methanocorpusculum sp.]|nr:hypothetical protein [Methanocorpusculum sp.]
MITDAGIFVNESKMLLQTLGALKTAGFARAVVFSEIKGKNTLSGIRISGNTTKELTNIAKKTGKDMILMVDAGNNNFNRTALLTRNVKLMSGLDALPKAGFDHITAKMAHDKNIGLVIELNKIIHGKTRRQALLHYADILKLQRKYRFPLVIASGAKSYLNVRSVQETIALCSLFGMERSEVYQALNALDDIMSPKNTVVVAE